MRLTQNRTVGSWKPLLSLFITLSLGVPCWGTSTAPAEDSPLRSSDRSLTMDLKAPQYRPQSSRFPGARIEGGTRGSDGNTPTVIPLVPDHVGLTIAKQPVLYWYLSKSTTRPVMFVLVDARAVQEIISVTLPPPFHPGVQLVRLQDYATFLAQGVQYRWYITVIVDPNAPARDIVAGGLIQRIVPESDPSDIPPPSNLDAVRFYAEAGLWYDAIAAISDLIATVPNDRALRQQRATLLRQVGLLEVAEWDLCQADRL